MAKVVPGCAKLGLGRVVSDLLLVVETGLSAGVLAGGSQRRRSDSAGPPGEWALPTPDRHRSSTAAGR